MTLVKLILDFHLASALDEVEFSKTLGGTMLKKLAIATLVLFCLSMAGCKNDAAVDSLMADFSKFSDELVAKVDANPTSAGVDEAQKYLDQKKPEMKKAWDAIKTSRVSEETSKRAIETVTQSATKVAGLTTKHSGAIAKDPAMATKLIKLLNDYRDIFPEEDKK